MPIPAALTAALPSIVSGAASLFGGDRANKQRAAEAQKNRDFQASQTSTAWQRGVKDMEAAGLNPALAYGQGPAASGGGSMAQQQDTITPAINSAMAGSKHKEEMAVLKANRYSSEQSGDAAQANARVANARAKQENLILQEYGKFNPSTNEWEAGPLTHQLRSQAKQAEYQAEAARLQLPGLRNSARAQQKMPYAEWLRLIMGSGGSNVLTSLSGLKAASLIKRNR